MAIHTTTDLESADWTSNRLAIFGITTSMAASAAELLKEDPDRMLSVRFTHSLKAVRDRLTELEQIRESALLEIMGSERQLTEPELLAALSASNSGEQTDNDTEEFRTWISSIIADVVALIDNPTKDVAERVEGHLGPISESGIRAVRSIDAERRNSDSPVLAHSVIS